MNRNWRTWAFTGLVSVIGGLLPAAFSPASAQDIVPQENRGVPQDWSHRNAIVRNAETMKEASGKGVVAFERWKQKLKDPRYTMAVAKKTIDVQPTANKIFSGQQLAYAQKGKQNPPLSTLKRDWNVALGNATAVDNAGTGTGVGTEGMFPAKFTWNINATPSCANDFIVYSTMTPGATSGTSARQTVSFGGSGGPPDWTALNSGAGTLTIQNGAGGPSIVLVAQNAASPTANEGLNFYVGNSGSSNSRAFWAYNLAAAINRNGVTVGVSATSSDGVVTIVANAVGPAGNGITLASTAALNTQLFMTLGGTNLAGGVNGGVQPTLVAYNQLYKTTCQATQTNAGSPNIRWQVNTGTGAIVETSPVLSFDGTQVAFVQRTAAATSTSSTSLSPGQTAELVLLKWAATGPTMSAPSLAPDAAAYRTCSAPCMFKFALGANNQNSSPYVDYANDRIYVGDAYGRLHRFDNVFNGTPVAATSWPVTVSSGNMLSSPVFDSVSNQVFVGSDVSEVVSGVDAPYTGGMLHRVDAGSRTVVNSSQIGAQVAAGATSRAKMSGVRDGAIVDSASQKVYAFLETDTKTDCGGTTSCKAVFQFNTLFAAGFPSAAEAVAAGRQFGRGQIAGRVTYIGQFDDAYWSSSDPASPSGNLYVCGSGADGAVSRQPTLFRIPITNNVFGVATPVVELSTLPAAGEVGATCSPITIIKNGANEYLFVGVSANGNTTGCTGPAGLNGCIYMAQLNAANMQAYDTTTTPAAVPAAVRYMSVSTPGALSLTEGPVLTTRASAATFTSMKITQSVANPNNRTILYTLRKNGSNTAISCSTANNSATNTCTGSVSYAAGDTLSVSAVRSSGTSTAMTIRVELTGTGTPAAGLPVAGGPGGIVVDNISSTTGASQVYISTRARPGRAVQASQAGLN
jgi:hypothetical protein